VIQLPKDFYDQMEDDDEAPDIFDDITDDQMIAIVYGE